MKIDRQDQLLLYIPTFPAYVTRCHTFVSDQGRGLYFIFSYLFKLTKTQMCRVLKLCRVIDQRSLTYYLSKEYRLKMVISNMYKTSCQENIMV